jgi:membrane associated rhomboid family serine protease
MIPLGDDHRAKGPAVVTLTLIGLCVLIFAWQLAWRAGEDIRLLGFAFLPGNLFGGVELPAGLPAVSPPATLVTYMFFHGGWMHLLGNLLYLWIFAPAVEDELGCGTFTVLFILTGIAAALLQAWPDTESGVPLIGASGGVSGVLGAYLLLRPRANVRILVPVGVVLDVVRLPAFVVLLTWFALQLLYTEWAPQDVGGIAFRAHVGGFVAGYLLAPLLRALTRDRVPLAAS